MYRVANCVVRWIIIGRERGIETQRGREMLANTCRKHLYVSHNSATVTPRLNKDSNSEVSCRGERGFYFQRQSLFASASLFFFPPYFIKMQKEMERVTTSMVCH